MMGLISNLLFLNPYVLWGLAALPALWLLLRITPPAPRRIALPTTRFLAGLVPEKQTSSHTPWWILLLRILIAALVIIALARPVYNPADNGSGSGAVQIVIDNSWPAASVWDTEIRAALDLTAQAGRAGRELYILTTAPLPGENKPATLGPLSAGQAEAVLKGMEPQAWPADYAASAALASDKAGETIWFSHGLDEGSIHTLADKLKNLTYIAPPPEQLPLLLIKDKNADSPFQFSVVAPQSIPPGRPATIQALSSSGALLDQKSVSLDPSNLPASITFDIPDTMRGDVSLFRLGGHSGAGGVYLLDESTQKKTVGILGPNGEEESKPFIEARFYLKRALDPFANFFQGTIQDILSHNPSVIILPDIAAMTPDDLGSLETWVKKGGLLLRFAGANMAKSRSEPFLTPVPLRLGGRSMDGAMTWETPAKLKSFDPGSPFYGIHLYEDIPVRQQILAQPTDDIDEKTWARLEDGTPLITAAPMGKGLLVMVHTTAAPDWSDLPLSGVFVDILRRILNISSNPHGALTKTDGMLQPLRVLDGFGALKKPFPGVVPVSAVDLDTKPPGSDHPPGLYGRDGFQKAVNIGDHIGRLKTPAFDNNVTVRTYGTEYERDLMPPLLYMALMLLLADWIVMSLLISGFKKLSRVSATIIIFSFIAPASAQTAKDMEYADGFYLAFIKSGNTAMDATTLTALQNLGEALRSRTSIEPAGVAALDPEQDELVFFPLIYWPVGVNETQFSGKAIKNIQNYLDHGGTILFDTRDRSYSSGTFAGTPNVNALRSLTVSLNIPPLEALPRDHVLNRSFYLLNPGRSGGYDPGTIWVQSAVSGRDGVSPVLIGSHDWAAAWAAGASSSRFQDMEFRFGINLVMYALTGNYKADQVHIPYILERLGE